MVAHPRRHEPCITLRERGIPCLVWFEDALASYGVPTVVFDLHLLVADLDEAAHALIDSGWTDAGPRNSPYDFLRGVIPQRRLNPPNWTPPSQKPITWPPPPPSQEPPGPTTTILLPTADWNVSTETLRSLPLETFVPPLNLVVDALIDSLLDSPADTDLRTRLTTYVAYLYDYCKELKAVDFAANLLLEHRQYHYDRLTKPYPGPVPFIREQRPIRDEIREGKRQPEFHVLHLRQDADEAAMRQGPKACVDSGSIQGESREADVHDGMDASSDAPTVSDAAPGRVGEDSCASKIGTPTGERNLGPE